MSGVQVFMLTASMTISIMGCICEANQGLGRQFEDECGLGIVHMGKGKEMERIEDASTGWTTGDGDRYRGQG